MNKTAQSTASPGPNSTAPPEANPVKKLNKKRVRNFTADDRAAHRIFEKGRREAFKERLIELATQIPALNETDPQRLSKHVVVDESIARHKLLESQCLEALHNIRSLTQERDELLVEVNNWRRSTGASQRQSRRASVNLDGLIEVEKDSQRRASTVRPSQTSRKISEQSGSSVDDQTRGDRATNSLSDDAASGQRGLPSEPAQDDRAVSELDGLLLDASWHRNSQAQTSAFAPESSMNALGIPDHQPSLQGNLSDSMSAPPRADMDGMEDYQLLGIGSHQPMDYQNMNAMGFSAETTFESTQIPPLSPSYLTSSASMQQGMSFQTTHQQQWVSWPG
ncbi:hypothetical protein C8034_v008563 [Colletotrichum sidae]|uniref:BHLH domain-containing protein n=1 Tax=Colletotrichum sidae TaxID=1347389 RepID=A0A4R8TPV3_9PEZI|nr:hypothetical protein C8034_v008563 [Colletotrichum sidae]